jgi:hypothetical protein
MKTITWKCPDCHRLSQAEAIVGDVLCVQCSACWGVIESLETIFERCPHCTCRQFYHQKDFNQALGCFILLIGILLVPKTYGLSLAAFAALDWLFHQKVRSLVVCYRCASEFRGFPIPQRLKPFMHHIGLKYDKYRK